MSCNKQKLQSIKNQSISLKNNMNDQKFDFSRNKIKEKRNYKVKIDLKFKNFQKKKIIRINTIRRGNYIFFEKNS